MSSLATDPALADALVAHWAARGDLDFIRRDLARRGLDPACVTVDDLARYDQLHAGQLTSSRVFAAWVGVPADARVLDLGAGLGGTARLLAAEHGCRIVAVELSPPLHETGGVLTDWLGLTPLVEHRCADLLTDREPAEFDLVWLQHVDMHVPDKSALYARAARALAPGGRVVWHDWLAGPGGPPVFPVPWSDAGELSSLSSAAAFSQETVGAGLEVTRHEPVVEQTRGWFSHTLDGLRRALASLPADALRRRARHERLATRAANVIRNLDEARLVPFFGEARRRF